MSEATISACRAARARNVEETRARRAMKNGLILETMMISRTKRKPAFSIRTGFSVSTGAFLPEEDLPVANRDTDSAVISYRLWRERFGGDPRIPGHLLKLDGNPFFVVGVMPSYSYSYMGSSRMRGQNGRTLASADSPGTGGFAAANRHARSESEPLDPAVQLVIRPARLEEIRPRLRPDELLVEFVDYSPSATTARSARGTGATGRSCLAAAVNCIGRIWDQLGAIESGSPGPQQRGERLERGPCRWREFVN